MNNRTQPESTAGRTLAIPEITVTSIVKAGAGLARRHPVPSAAYALGLLICILFTGVSMTEVQKRQFHDDVSAVDYAGLDAAHADALRWNQKYHESKGFFFSCNDICQKNKINFERADGLYRALKLQEVSIVSDAKSKIGIFSELGVKETREAFWERYTQGKGFAERQTKFDAAFFGFRAMLRDESLLEYVMTILVRVLFNFTLGVIATVVTFAWSSIGVIQSFQASPITAILFFSGAFLAALSFAATWLFAVVAGVGVTAYATVKLAATTVRIEGGGGGGRPHIR